VTVAADVGRPRAVAPKKAVFDPEGTITVAGTSSDSGLSLERSTGVSEGAGMSRFTRLELKLPGVKHCRSSETEATLGVSTTLS